MNNTLPTLALGEAIAALVEARKKHQPQAVFVSTMSAQFALDMLGETTRRVDSVPLMGGAAGIGLGIALARPDVPVVVIDGDSSLLMELGGLATVVYNRPRRYLHIVVANGVQFNGAYNLPNVAATPGFDFAGMARAAGYDHAQRIDNAAEWAAALPALLAQEGTSFVELAVRIDPPRFGAENPQPLLPDIQFTRMRMGARRLAAELSA